MDPSKSFPGAWTQSGSGVLTEYIFAANGNFQFIGAYGTTSTVSQNYADYIEIKSSAWQGDGSYAIKGNQLNLKKRGDPAVEQVQFRFEKVNHGGTGWRDRLYMLKTDLTLGKPYEVCYEKRN